MNRNNNVLHVNSLGRFSLSIGGEPVLSPWPSELTKMLFCSLLSPLDEFITYDRLSRSLFGTQLTNSTKARLELLIEALFNFTGAEMGINPFRYGNDAISLNLSAILVDAHLFQEMALEGLRKVSLGDSEVAMRNIRIALSHYGGDFLPGMNQRIIADTREELASLKRMIMPLEITKVQQMPRYAPVRGLVNSVYC